MYTSSLKSLSPAILCCYFYNHFTTFSKHFVIRYIKISIRSFDIFHYFSINFISILSVNNILL